MNQRPNISYLITFSNETDTLKRLLNQVYSLKENNDEIVLLSDVGNYGVDTQNILSSFLTDNKSYLDKTISYYEKKLDNDYSNHKNWGAKQCKGNYIFQIDGDELPNETLLTNIKDIIEANPGIELFWIPRVNDFKGVTQTHADQWGWRLTESPTYNRPIVNFPDYQGRLFLNKTGRIKWVGRLHERIEGHLSYVYLPPDEELSLYHDKTIEKQIETNLRYNKDFSKKENQGFKLPT